MKKLTSLLLLSILLIISCEDNPSSVENQYSGFEEKTQNLLIELEKIAIPISGSDPSLDDFDLKFLDQFSETKIVALGEATHGTKEFFQMKHRIFKYLVEHHKFKVFAFEADYAETLPINQYIVNGTGDLDNLMKNTMHFWTWRTEEVKSLLQWMREYNTTKSDNDKIHFLGYDCQIKDYYPDMIREYLNKVDTDYFNQVDSTLLYLSNSSYDYFRNIPQEKSNEYFMYFDNMYSDVLNKKNAYINKSSEFDFKTNLQLINVLKQIVEVSSTRSINNRDKYMAENHSWILELFSNDTKIVSWAHNGHVFNDPIYWGGGAMGSYLRKDYSLDYKIIGFGFSEGKFQAVGYNDITKQYTGLQIHDVATNPLSESSNYLFHNLAIDNYCIDFANLGYGNLYNFFSKPLPFFMVGAVYSNYSPDYYRDYDLTTALDLLIYFDKTNAAIPLK